MSQGYEAAGGGRRFIAITIDWWIAFLTSVLFLPFQSGELASRAMPLVIFFLEVSLLTILTGSSAGQRLFGVQVVSWPDRGYLPPLRVILRTFLIVLVIPAVVYDREGRGLHDRIARSVVIRAGSGS